MHCLDRCKILAGQIAGVGFFHDHHARVLAQFPRQLALAHVHGKHLYRAALQQAVREAAGGRPEINRGEAGDVELKMFQRVFQLVAAPADEFLRRVHGDSRRRA